MNELGLDVLVVREWFPNEHESPYVLIRVRAEHATAWAASVGVAVRRCYISDRVLTERSEATGQTQSVVIAAALPDPGAVMAGDFGEILGYIYQAATVHPERVLGAKKWRLKHDRNKPAPGSDVVQFVLPAWPRSTDQDCVLCAEVKTKSTSGSSTPVASALADCKKDRTTRLARTLVWLKERALLADLESVEIAQIDRFISATEHPPARKVFRAIAVICDTLAEAELSTIPAELSEECVLVVLVVPQLRQTYSEVFAAAGTALLVTGESRSERSQ